MAEQNSGRYFPPEEERAQPAVAVLPRCRDGAEKSYFVCQTTWGHGPTTLIDYSSRLNFGAGHRVKSVPLGVGRGVGQGYFASGAGGVGSIPTWVEKSSGSVVRAPNVPWPNVPVQQFF